MPPISTPEFIEQCKWVYDQLLAEAETNEDETVWEGVITKWFGRKKLSTDKYSRIMQALKGMGCIEMLAQGNRHAPTVMIMHFEPSVERWVASHSDGSFERLSKKVKERNVEQKIELLQKRVDDLEMKVEALMEAAEANAETS